MSEHDPADHVAGDDTRDHDLREALSGLSRLSTASHDLSTTLISVAEFAVRAIPNADGAGLTLFHDQRAHTIVASAPFVSEVDDIQYGLGEGPCIAAAATGLTMRSGSLGAEARWRGSVLASADSECTACCRFHSRSATPSSGR